VCFSVGQQLTSVMLAQWADAKLEESERAANASMSSWPAVGDDAPPINNAPLYRYLTAASCFGLLCMLRGGLAALFFTRSSKALHERMLLGVLGQPMRFFDTTPVGRILNRFSGDVMQCDILLPRLFDIWTYVCGTNLMTLLLAAILAPPMILIDVLLLCGFKMLYHYYATVAVALQRLFLVSLSPIIASYSSFIIGLESIRAFDRVDTFSTRFRKLQEAFLRAFNALQAVERFTMASAISCGVTVFMVSLSSCLLLLSRFRILVTPGSAGVVLGYAAVLAFRLPAMLLMSSNLEKILAASQRIIEFAELPPEETRPRTLKQHHRPPTHSRVAADAARATTLDVAHASWPASGTLRLIDVSLRYAPTLPPVLKSISLEVAHGERLGLCGRTGAGKSSLLLALLRMADVEGVIEIGGVDVCGGGGAPPVSRQLLRSRLGVIPQDSWLFSGSLRFNLDVAGVYSDAQLWKALELAQLAPLVRSLEGGLEAAVSEKGSNFSSGQVQLICLARVLLKQSPIVLMDEATASVDLKTDALVQQTVRSALGVATLVTIAHRIHTIIDYDSVAVLSGGVIAEHGTPHALLQRPSGLFTTLVDATGAESAAELRERAAGAAMSADKERSGTAPHVV